jgi:hypothetical protein
LSYHFKDEYINVTSFDTPQNPNELQFEQYDIVKNNGINRIPVGPPPMLAIANPPHQMMFGGVPRPQMRQLQRRR